jgi:glycosyltransferase involved in cell wall biosynthesis
MKDWVSVIIPTYNSAHFIEDAINGALSQTYPHVEIVVVDDGSTDNLHEVLKQYEDKLRLIVQENRGLSAARNTGIRSSTGEYLAFLDADDFWKPEKLALQMEVFKRESSVGVVYTGVMDVDASGAPLQYKECTQRGSILDQLLENNCLVASASAVKRECFEKVGFFDEQLTASEDWDLWLRIAPYYGIDFVDRPLTCYRLHSQNMHKDASRMERNILRVLDKAFEAGALRRRGDDFRRATIATYHLRFAEHYFGIRDMANTRRNVFAAWSLDPRAIGPSTTVLVLKSLLGKRIITLLSRWKSRLGLSATAQAVPTDHGERIRVCICAPLFFPIVGGTELQTKLLGKALLEQGVDLTVVTQKIPSLKTFEVLDGIPVHRAIRPVSLGPLFGLTYMISLAWFLVRHGRSFAVIHFRQAYLGSVVGLLLNRLLKKKVLITIAGGGESGDLQRIKNMKFGSLILNFLSKADGFLALSEQISDDLRTLGVPNSKILKVANAVDTLKFAPPSADERKAMQDRLSPAQEKVVIYIGRLAPEKGVDVLIDAWTLVSKSCEDSILFVVGAGSEEETLKDQVRALNLQGSVRFLGQVDDVYPSLAVSDIFVLPSRAEGLPNALLEAMACGLPSVCSALGGCPDLIGLGVGSEGLSVEELTVGESGLLVPPNKPHHLAAGILRLLEDERLRETLGQRARLKAVEHYSLKTVATHYRSIYASILGRAAPSHGET